MKETKKQTKAKVEKVETHVKSNSNTWILGLLVLNILLTLSIILPMGSFGEHEEVEEKISTIETKVNAIDNFFRSNVPEYDSEGSAQLGDTQPSNTVPTPTVEMSADDDPYLGADDAKVEVIEFSDYQCPFCRKYWQESYPQIKEEYIDTNKIKYVFRDFPLNFHPGAPLASIAGNCIAEQKGNEAYFEFHDIVFGEQAKQGSGTIQFGEDEVMSWVSQIDGLDMDAFDTCYNDPAQKAEVDADFAAGAEAGVSGTPSFFINGKLLVGAQPYSVIKAEIDRALNE